MPRLVLLGGGHAHLQVLRAFAREPLSAGSRVVLVSPHAELVYSGMVPGFVAGHYAAAECTIAIEPLAARAGIAFVQQAAVALDANARRVQLADGSALAYDVLSLDIGSVMDRDAIPGAREHAVFVRPVEHFAAACDGLFARVPAPAVVVVGAGAAGVELALALRYRLRSRVSLVGAELLAGYPAGMQRRARRALERNEVALFEQGCRRVHAGGVELANGEGLHCDVALLAIGGSAPRWLATSGLALDVHGHVATGEALQSTSHAEVFAAGDVASRADAPRPRSGVYAVRAGPALAANLRAFAAGAEPRPYRPQRWSLNLLACGEPRAIASWGPLAAEGRWAWRWKDRIDRGFVAGFAAEARS